MEFDVVFDAKLNVVSVKANEALSYWLEMEIVKEILEIASKNKCRKILYDYSEATVPVSRLDIYELPEYFEKWGVPRNLMMAFVYSDNENLFRFLETVARNNGFVARVFKSKDKAIGWLTNDSLRGTPES